MFLSLSKLSMDTTESDNLHVHNFDANIWNSFDEMIKNQSDVIKKVNRKL